MTGVDHAGDPAAEPRRVALGSGDEVASAAYDLAVAAPRPVGRAAELAALSPRSAVLQLAWPGIIENVVAAVSTTIVFAFVGRLGAESLAAYGVSLQFLFLLFPVWMSLSIGTIALVSRRMGAGRPAEAAAYARQALLIGLAVALLSGAVFVLFAEDLALLLGAEPAVARTARPYLQLAGGANAITTLLFVGLAALRGAGDTRSPLWITLLASTVTVPLAYLLVGSLGLIGVALAGLAGNGIGLLWTYALLARGQAGLRLGLGRWRFDLEQARTLLRISVPASGEQALWSIGLLAITFVALRLGTEAYAGHNVILQVETISFFPCFGFGVAASALVGQSLGMADERRGVRGAYAAIQAALVWTSIVALAFVLFAEPIFRVFTSDAAVLAAGVPALRLIGLGQPTHAFTFVFGGALRGAGDTRFMFKLTAFEWLVVRLPLVVLFTLGLGWGLAGVWAMFLVDYFVRAAALTWRFRSGVWARLRY